MAPGSGSEEGALDGIRVLDLATIYAGPLTAAVLGDFGADVIKVEHPRGDPMRTHGASKDGHGLWWKVVSRNKRAVTLDLSGPRGQELLLQLVERSDVVIESFRPGVMERWNLGYEQLKGANPGIVMLRVSGFGQFGPYRSRPGFGTLAEAMSGFADMTGEPGGPPTLPPFGLADGIAGLAGTAAVMFALFHRQANGGVGQMIDLSIIEPIFSLLGAQATMFDQLGLVPVRNGNRSTNNAPRNTYRTADGRWIAVSTSADRIAERVLRLVGHPEVIEEDWFATGGQRAAHAVLLDSLVAPWIAARTSEVVLAAFAEAGAAAAPVYDIAGFMDDPQVDALEAITTVPDEDLGDLKMQNVLFRMTDTPGRIRFAGRRLGQDNDEVYASLLDMSYERLAALRGEGVI